MFSFFYPVILSLNIRENIIIFSSRNWKLLFTVVVNMPKHTHTHTVTEALTLPLHWLVGCLECGDETNKSFGSFYTQRILSAVIMMFTGQMKPRAVIF